MLSMSRCYLCNGWVPDQVVFCSKCREIPNHEELADKKHRERQRTAHLPENPSPQPRKMKGK